MDTNYKYIKKQYEEVSLVLERFKKGNTIMILERASVRDFLNALKNIGREESSYDFLPEGFVKEIKKIIGK